MTKPQYLDDLSVGQKFGSGRLTLERDAILRFATEFDPQPFHLDDEAAQATIFRGLAASGWHTAAVTMGLLVDGEFRPAGGIVGAGVDDLRWPRPARPGDTLRVESEVLEVRPSQSRPEQGIVRLQVTTFNQDDAVLQTFVASLVVQRRP